MPVWFGSLRGDGPAISVAIVPSKDSWDGYSESERPQLPPSLRQAYRAGSEGTPRDLRFGEGLIPVRAALRGGN
jgi:hypothetical protein